MRYSIAFLALPILAASSVTALGADTISSQQFEERHSGAAVSDVNAKIDFGYYHGDFGNDGDFSGEFDSAQGKFVQGAVSIPVGSMFGLQIDAGSLNADVAGANGTEDFGMRATGVAGHFFWRDPGVGLLGVYAHQTTYVFDNSADDRIVNTRMGVEAEGYFGAWTLKGFAGQDKLDWNYATNDETFLVAKGEIDFYLNDNFVISAGVDHSFETTSGTVGVEAMMDTGGFSPSLFASAKFSDNDQSIVAGLRIYLGKTAKSLKARHREDDPEIYLFDNFASIGSCLNGALSGGEPMMVVDETPVTIIEPVQPEGTELDGCDSNSPEMMNYNDL